MNVAAAIRSGRQSHYDLDFYQDAYALHEDNVHTCRDVRCKRYRHSKYRDTDISRFFPDILLLNIIAYAVYIIILSNRRLQGTYIPNDCMRYRIAAHYCLRSLAEEPRWAWLHTRGTCGDVIILSFRAIKM